MGSAVVWINLESSLTNNLATASGVYGKAVGLKEKKGKTEGGEGKRGAGKWKEDGMVEVSTAPNGGHMPRYAVQKGRFIFASITHSYWTRPLIPLQSKALKPSNPQTLKPLNLKLHALYPQNP